MAREKHVNVFCDNGRRDRIDQVCVVAIELRPPLVHSRLGVDFVVPSLFTEEIVTVAANSIDE